MLSSRLPCPPPRPAQAQRPPPPPPPHTHTHHLTHTTPPHPILPHTAGLPSPPLLCCPSPPPTRTCDLLLFLGRGPSLQGSPLFWRPSNAVLPSALVRGAPMPSWTAGRRQRPSSPMHTPAPTVAPTLSPLHRFTCTPAPPPPPLRPGNPVHRCPGNPVHRFTCTPAPLRPCPCSGRRRTDGGRPPRCRVDRTPPPPLYFHSVTLNHRFLAPLAPLLTL